LANIYMMMAGPWPQAHTLVEVARGRVVENVVRPLGEDQFAAALGACRATDRVDQRSALVKPATRDISFWDF